MTRETQDVPPPGLPVFIPDIDALAPLVFEHIPRPSLDILAEAGQRVREAEQEMQQNGTHPVHVITDGAELLADGEHFPESDVYDMDSHSQYYFHAHRQESGEVGHFHCFMRHRGLPDGMTPFAMRPSPSSDPEQDRFAHLIAVSVDERGQAIQLFTTNRWVTNEMIFPADQVIAALDRFSMTADHPGHKLNQWITSILVLFRPQIEMLIHARDRTFNRWADKFGVDHLYESEALEVTSMVPISVEDQIRRIDAARGV